MRFIFTFIRKQWKQIEHEAKMEEHRQLTKRREKISALHSNAVNLRLQHRHKEAIAVLDQIENEFQHEIDPDIRRTLSWASREWVLNRGLLHSDDGELPPDWHLDRNHLQKIITRRENIIKSHSKKGVSVANMSLLAEQEKTIKSYLRKAFSLEKLNRHEEALAVLQHIQGQFGSDLHPLLPEKASEIKKKIAAKHFPPSASYDDTHKHLILQAKQSADEAERQELLLKVATSNTDLLLKSNDLNVGIEARIRGNLAYALFLLGRHEEASQALWECLQLERKSQLEAQRAYTQQHRIEPQDSDYEALLMKVVGSLQKEMSALEFEQALRMRS